jgi:tetratricopeptide (TPR) repeat protein
MDKLLLEPLYARYSKAFKNSDWKELSECSADLGRILVGNPASNVMDIRDVAQKYLGSLVGSGRFLFTKVTDNDLSSFEEGLLLIEKQLARKNKSIESALVPVIKSAYELQLFLLKPQSDNLNKASAALRVLARPDLAIELVSIQIAQSRLNYFSRNIRAAAYSDLRNFSAAIEDAQIGLKYSPKDKAHYLHVSLARALVGRFKATGDLEDCEKAFFHAEQAFRDKPDNYSANTFLKVIHALGTVGLEDLIASLEAVGKNPTNLLDMNALEIARDVIKKSKSDSSRKPDTPEDSSFIDPWFDDFSEIEEEIELDLENDEEDSVSDYFEDYFEEYSDSLNDPQRPHLEP